MQGENMTAVFAQWAMVFAAAVFLIHAGSFFAKMRQPREGKKPVALFCFVECMVFVCIVMFLSLRFGTTGGVAAYLIPAAGLTVALNFPLLAGVWIMQAKKKEKPRTRNP